MKKGMVELVEKVICSPFYQNVLALWRVFGAGHPWMNGGNQACCCNPGERGQNHSSGGRKLLNLKL